MKIGKWLMMAVMLVGVSATVQAEGGAERSKAANEQFRAEQARIWG